MKLIIFSETKINCRSTKTYSPTNSRSMPSLRGWRPLAACRRQTKTPSKPKCSVTDIQVEQQLLQALQISIYNRYLETNVSTGLDKDPKFISDSMSTSTPPEKAAESAVLVSGGFDPCQYQVILKPLSTNG